MFFGTIWERYFLRQIAKTFALFLFGFYGLYVLIDYSNHAASFKHYHFGFVDILRFYTFEFAKQMGILIPFAILISCVRTLCALNVHNELIALMASGVRIKRILLPFALFGLFFTFFVYFNTEILQPMAWKHNTQLDHSRAKAKQKKHVPIQQLTLADHTSLIFQDYFPGLQEFFDVYWVHSIDDIYRMRRLSFSPSGLTGYSVEHLQRDAEGLLIPKEFFEEKDFSDLHFDKEALGDSLTSPESFSLSTLREKLPESDDLNEKEARLLTAYYYKMALPWFCLLAILAPAPFCIRFSRTLPVFFIYALSILGLVFFYLVMNAAVVLGERQVVAPAIAIWAPFISFFLFFTCRFLKL